MKDSPTSRPLPRLLEAQTSALSPFSLSRYPNHAIRVQRHPLKSTLSLHLRPPCSPQESEALATILAPSPSTSATDSSRPYSSTTVPKTHPPPGIGAVRHGTGLHVPVRGVADPQEAHEEAGIDARLEEVHPPGVLAHQVELQGQQTRDASEPAVPPSRPLLGQSGRRTRWGLTSPSLNRTFTRHV